MLGFIITGFEAQFMEEVIAHNMETCESLLHGGSQNRLVGIMINYKLQK
jgi:hypothetical protein